MVLVDIQIAFAGEVEVECTVAGKQLKHVIEKSNPGRDFVSALAFDRKFQRDACLVRVPDDGRTPLSSIRAFPGLKIETRGTQPL
jgi:hypothetical protein